MSDRAAMTSAKADRTAQRLTGSLGINSVTASAIAASSQNVNLFSKSENFATFVKFALR